MRQKGSQTDDEALSDSEQHEHVFGGYSGAPRAPKARARGAPLVRKYGNPSIRENLVMTSPYARPYVRTYVRTYVRPSTPSI